jgi:glyoxylase-like metal-dependent hydrolase (beta-lactamase superfamily II)
VPGLLAALDGAGVKPEAVDYIILTHIHLDHAGGTGTLLKSLPNATVVAHSRAIAHLIEPTKLWEASLSTLGDLALRYGQIESVPAERIVAAEEGMKITLGEKLELEVYLTPGHATHHLSLFEKSSSLLFAGEAAGACINGCLRPATPPPFKLEEALASLDKLIGLKPENICYGHFGCYGDGLKRLKSYREKLLRWHEVVNSQAKKGTSPEEILSVIRGLNCELDYLDKLDKAEYEREFRLIVNSIYGLAGSVRGERAQMVRPDGCLPERPDPWA